MLHPHAKDALGSLLDAIDDDVPLTVFGSAVRKDYRPGVSDINLLVALSDMSTEALIRVGEPLRDAWRGHRIAPYLVRPDELVRLADAFPMRTLDMQRHHAVLRGDDLLENIEVRTEHLRVRVEQELRNRLVRTRRRVALGADDPASLEQTARNAAHMLRLELWALLIVRGHDTKHADVTTVFAAATQHLPIDTNALSTVEGLATSDERVQDPVATLSDVLTVLEAAVRLADQDQ